MPRPSSASAPMRGRPPPGLSTPTNDGRYWRETPRHSLYLTREGVAYYRQEIEAHEKGQREARILYLNT